MSTSGQRMTDALGQDVSQWAIFGKYVGMELTKCYYKFKIKGEYEEIYHGSRLPYDDGNEC